MLDRSAAAAAPHLREKLAVTVHGGAELFELTDPAGSELRQAMLDHYLPLQGPRFEIWLDATDSLGARIVPAKISTFSLGPKIRSCD